MAQLGYDEAALAVIEGNATPHALWVLLNDEYERDGYALKPVPWEGPGEYQHVEFHDGRGGRFVRLPENARSLIDLAKRRANA